MKTTDKILICIVAGIVLLIVVAFVFTFTRPEATYLAEDTPEGIAHNYLLALQKEEYERAYSYLSPTIKGYPSSVDKFIKHVHNNAWQFRLNVNATLSVESTKITGNSAVVAMRETRFRGGDLFDSGQSSSLFNMDLHLENGVWKIVDSDYYFAWCWGYLDRCN
jgi:hypothetical protein